MRLLLYSAILQLAVITSNAQGDSLPVKELHFKNGEVLDIILNSQFPNTSDLVNRYKETAFPVAFEYSYQLQPSFDIQDLILGNHKPQYLIFGKWSSLKNRIDFLDEIVKKVPDFHDQRKQIFDEFVVTHYEVNEDIDLTLDANRYNVVSSFWQGEAKILESFSISWTEKVKQNGGVQLIQLENGNSPLGYRYAPDLLYITQWESKEHFEKFQKQNPLSSYSDLEDVHQFSIMNRP